LCFRPLLLSVATLGLAAFSAGAVFAQTAKDLSPGQTVPSSFQPLGIQLGSFLVYPSMIVETEFDDNIFRTEEDPVFDKIVKFMPAIGINSDWAVHGVSAEAHADVGNFIDTNKEDYEDYGASVSGRLDVIPDEAFVSVRIAGDWDHEARGTADDPGSALGPTEFIQGIGEAVAEYRPDQFLFRVTGQVLGLDFQNNGDVNNNDRDRVQFLVKPRVGFEFQPGTMIFVETWYDKREFIHTPDDSGVDRSSEGFRFLGGATVDLGELTFIELSAGWFIQEFEDPTLSKSSGFDFEGIVYWAITDVMTFTAGLGRATQDTTSADASSVVTSSIRTRLEWEAQDNLLFFSDLNYANSAFEGESERVDDQIDFGLGTQYFFHENFFAGFAYQFSIRESSEIGSDFINNRWIARIGAQI